MFNKFIKLNVFAVGLGACLLLSQACSHKKVAPESAPPAKPAEPLKNPVTLKFVGERGRDEFTDNCSLSTTETYVKGNLLHKKVEVLDFKVKASTVNVLGDGDIVQNVKTMSKDGPGNLHDLAYPEVDETMQVEYAPGGTVVHAGQYPKDSLFYLPPLPLPVKPVNPGDTWTAAHTWKSGVSGAPLTVSLTAKYTAQKQCGEHMCVDVEVKGEVHMPPRIEKRTGFVHKIIGRFLFDPVRGLLVWSEFGSDEQLQGKEVRAAVHSVLRSELVEPPGYRTVSREEPSCPFENKE